MNISVTISNDEDIQYLSQFESRKQNDLINTALTIGLKSIQMSEVHMNCNSYIEPINEIIKKSTSHHITQLNDIESKLDDILFIKNNSSRKGKLSEDICRNILNKYYNNWSFEDVSQEGYGGDCRASCTPVGDILYEFKNYDYNVNKDQITKFIRDLEHTNISYGVFVSNTSGIVGKQNIEWEIINNKLIVYVSNMGFNGYGCIIGTELLLSLAKLDILNKDKNRIIYNNYELNEIVENISESIEKLKMNIELYTKHKEIISEQRIKINQSIDHIEKSSFDCLLELKSSFDFIISKTKDITSKETYITNFNKESFLNNIESSKFKTIYEKLLIIVNAFDIKSDDKNLYILKENELICYTKQCNSKIDIIFPIKDSNVNINIEYEKYKNKEIIIEMKDKIHIWGSITNRINI